MNGQVSARYSSILHVSLTSSSLLVMLSSGKLSNQGNSEEPISSPSFPIVAGELPVGIDSSVDLKDCKRCTLYRSSKTFDPVQKCSSLRRSKLFWNPFLFSIYHLRPHFKPSFQPALQAINAAVDYLQSRGGAP